MTKLITYPDALGGNLKELEQILDTEFAGLFTGVHILPPYPSSGDRGFAPIDYKKIDPEFGSWADLSALASKYDVTLDFMVNHVSAQSEMFQDYLNKGENSKYKNFFLTPEKIFGVHEPSTADLAKLVLRREKPWSDYKLANGETVRIWTTFGADTPSEQLDVDINDKIVREYYRDLLAFFAGQGIKELRMDAIAYVTKRKDTSCFFVEPEIYEFMDWIEGEADKVGIKILHEIHAALPTMKKLAKHGYKNYDFLLSYAILQALLLKNGDLILNLLTDEDRPDNWVTLIDCHDGIPIQPDMNGLLDVNDMVEVVNITRENGAGFSELHSIEKAYDNAPNVHQICGTLYSLLGENDDAFVTARAIQLFAPGTAQIYYEGLLGGVNDEDGFARTNDPRELNRRNYSAAEVREAMQRSRVQRVCKVIRYRNNNEKYMQEFHARMEGDNLVMAWQDKENLDNEIALVVDFKSGKSFLRETNKDEILISEL